VDIKAFCENDRKACELFLPLVYTKLKRGSSDIAVIFYKEIKKSKGVVYLNLCWAAHNNKLDNRNLFETS
jgi:hypothetical protein